MNSKRKSGEDIKEIDKWPTYPAPPTGRRAGSQLLLGIGYLTAAAVYIAFLVEAPDDVAPATKLLVLGLFLLFALSIHLYNKYFESFWKRITIILIQIAILAAIVITGKSVGSLSIAFFILIPMIFLAFNPVQASLLTLLCLCVLFFSIMIATGLDEAVSNILPYGGGFAFFAAISIALVWQQQEHQRAEALLVELEEAHQQLSIYAAQVEALAVAEERNRIARDIHDSLGHYLTAMTMQLQAAQKLVEKDHERTTASIIKAEEMARACLAEVRRAVAALRTSPLDSSSLNDAIKELVENFNNSGVAAALEISGDALPISTSKNTALYRAVQEGLTNVARHANASAVKIEISYSDEMVDLSIIDNGVGIHEDSKAGFGIAGLRERVEILGGSVEAGNAPGSGYRLAVHIPVDLDLSSGIKKNG